MRGGVLRRARSLAQAPLRRGSRGRGAAQRLSERRLGAHAAAKSASSNPASPAGSEAAPRSAYVHIPFCRCVCGFLEGRGSGVRAEERALVPQQRRT